MTRSHRTLLLVAALVTACELEDYVPSVPADAVEHPAGPLAVSASGDHVWLTDTPNAPPFAGPSRLVLADREDGSVLLTLGPWSGGNTIVDLETEYAHGPDDVWVLHASGFRSRWSPEGTMTSWEPPVPVQQYPATWRTYCALARDLQEGATYLTTHEFGPSGYQTFLWRYSDGTWERTPIATPNCPDVAFDLATQRVVTHDGLFRNVIWYDPTNLAALHAIEVSGPYYDFAAFNGKTALAGQSTIDIYDEGGARIEEEPGVDANGLHVHYGDNMVRLFFSGSDDPSGGPNAHAVGSFELVP